MPSAKASPFKVLNEGQAEGSTIRLTAPLNIWGGLDPASGMIVDPRHPQYGLCLAGHIVLTPPTRGSGTNAQIFAQACARGVGPAAVVLFAPDYVVAVGAMVAKRLYGLQCPVIAGPDDGWDEHASVVLRVSAAAQGAAKITVVSASSS
ncbi:aconitase X swivel domain-containing protein [Paenarthrobacter sp. NPDC091669]|uniref:aconitase X swivel domain-containing protein n=1 Tax=Paenarthrobacter sp. NPDC091669 TaxID=3364384 RepID=UPI0037FEE7BE